MKKYKVGDTIYAKGKIIQIAESHGKLPYCVAFSDSNITRIIDMCHAWLDEDSFVELPAKPALPKDVADELDDAKVHNLDFIGYMNVAIDNGYPVTNMLTYGNAHPSIFIKILSDAWFNGYTVEKESRYMVYVPGTNKKFLYNKRGDSSTRAAKLETPIVPSPVTSYQTAYGQYKPLYWFTDEEITKFSLHDCEREEVTDDGE